MATNHYSVDRACQDRPLAGIVKPWPALEQVTAGVPDHRDSAFALGYGQCGSRFVHDASASREALLVGGASDHGDQVRVPVRDELRFGGFDRLERVLGLFDCGGRLERDAGVAEPVEEQALDVAVDLRHADRCRRRADAGGVTLTARVAVVAACAVGGGGERVPAAGAADDPGQQGRDGLRRQQLRRRLRSLPFGPRDERLVRVGIRETAVASLTQVRAVPDDPHDCRLWPHATMGVRQTAVQKRAQALPALPGRTAAEQLADHRGCLRVELEPLVVSSKVADRRLLHRDTAADRTLRRRRPVLPDPFELEFGDREHHRASEPADRRGGVERVAHGDENTAGVIQPSECRGRVGDAPGEPVQGCDDHTVRFAPFDRFERAQEARSVMPATWLVEVFLPSDDRVTVRPRLRFDPVALNRGADEALAGAARDTAHAYVSDESHGASLAEWSVRCEFGTAPARSTSPLVYSEWGKDHGSHLEDVIHPPLALSLIQSEGRS